MVNIKDFYNTVIKETYPGTYEYARWFSTPQKKAGYDMTLAAISRYSEYLPQNATRYIEVGPGPGTWTKFFLEKYKNAQFDLVDISKEMLGMARDALKDRSNVIFHESDFVAFSPVGSKATYDVFFSSRALEYFPDKKKAVEKIHSLLRQGGKGLIITKTPHYARAKALGKELTEVHKIQISPEDLKKIFIDAGFSNIEIHPVTFVFPKLHSGLMDKLVHSLFSWMPVNPLSMFFSESYCILFTKS